MVMTETRTATLTIEANGTAHTRTVSFNFYPKALNPSPAYQLFRMNSVVTSALVDLGIVKGTDLLVVTDNGNTAQCVKVTPESVSLGDFRYDTGTLENVAQITAVLY